MNKIYLLFYYTLGMLFPPLPFPGSKLGQQFRSFCLRRCLSKCGSNIVPKHGCYIGNGEGLIICDRSQLSQNGRIGKDVEIGSDVIMAQEIYIITNAYSFEDPTISIN